MKSTVKLIEILDGISSMWIDGVNRAVEDSSKVLADGEYWAVISDHGNAEICHRGRNGRLYFDGSLV